MHEVIDNFLPRDEFLKIKDVVMGEDFIWTYTPTINAFHEDDTCYFTHMMYLFKGNTYTATKNFQLIGPILLRIKPKALIRVKCNLYPKTHTIQNHEPHKDYNYTHKGALFYLNTCDGYTTLEDDTKIETKENRMLLFDPSTPHSSTSTTNAKARFNINFNYF
jgi:hypothetical protein